MGSGQIRKRHFGPLFVQKRKQTLNDNDNYNIHEQGINKNKAPTITQVVSSPKEIFVQKQMHASKELVKRNLELQMLRGTGSIRTEFVSQLLFSNSPVLASLPSPSGPKRFSDIVIQETCGKSYHRSVRLYHQLLNDLYVENACSKRNKESNKLSKAPSALVPWVDRPTLSSYPSVCTGCSFAFSLQSDISDDDVYIEMQEDCESESSSLLSSYSVQNKCCSTTSSYASSLQLSSGIEGGDYEDRVQGTSSLPPSSGLKASISPRQQADCDKMKSPFPKPNSTSPDDDVMMSHPRGKNRSRRLTHRIAPSMVSSKQSYRNKPSRTVPGTNREDDVMISHPRIKRSSPMIVPSIVSPVQSSTNETSRTVRRSILVVVSDVDSKTSTTKMGSQHSHHMQVSPFSTSSSSCSQEQIMEDSSVTSELSGVCALFEGPFELETELAEGRMAYPGGSCFESTLVDSQTSAMKLGCQHSHQIPLSPTSTSSSSTSSSSCSEEPIMEASSVNSASSGISRFSDSRMFEGTYDPEAKWAEGRMNYPDGSCFEGTWINGKRDGLGQCFFPDGTFYMGEFCKGKYHGYGTILWPDGGFFAGDWRNNEIHGNGVEIRPDGTVRHDGQWHHGQPIRTIPENDDDDDKLREEYEVAE